MKKTLYTLALLTVLLLPGMGRAQERTGNGTVPYMLWIPAVVGPKVCEDPGIVYWGYTWGKACSTGICWWDGGFYIQYENIDPGYQSNSSFVWGYAKIKRGGGGEGIHEMYSSIYRDGISTGGKIEPGTYEVSFKVMCRDQTWSNWSDWKEIVVPDEE